MPLTEKSVISPFSTVWVDLQLTSGLSFTIGAGAHYSPFKDPAWADWAADTFTLVPSSTQTVCFTVWALLMGGLSFAQSADTMPGAPADIRERLFWGTIPPNATNITSQGALQVLRLEPGGADERGKTFG